jgi:hypothetical protein
MSSHAGNVAHTVKTMRAIVPAKDFEISQRFYRDCGLQPLPPSEGLVEMHLGRILLPTAGRLGRAAGR